MRRSTILCALLTLAPVVAFAQEIERLAGFFASASIAAFAGGRRGPTGLKAVLPAASHVEALA